MPLRTVILIACVSVGLLSAHSYDREVWGFYGHRLINKMAVFTLPVDLVPLYKSNIDFITEHSIDPDKRRHASSLEAVRHYIDLDIWDDYPFKNVPRTLPEAMVTFSTVSVIHSRSRDTLQSWTDQEIWNDLLSDYHRSRIIQDLSQRTFEIQEEKYIQLPDQWLPEIYDHNTHDLVFTERFTIQGILPYHLSFYQARLTRAFKDQDWPLVIRLSTEIGHYISDAHVPLHTTKNYDGQLTGQDGIHAFWESRIPELFAADQYDFFVGRARYVEDVDRFFWDVVLDSHTFVAEVLDRELEMRSLFDKDRQYCFEERGAVTTRLECRAYAEAYQNAMSGMVERQMQRSIQAVGSSWYTAWIDAGRPEIEFDKDRLLMDTSQVLTEDSLRMAIGH